MKQPKRILIMGLPGAGKTYLAEQVKAQLESEGKTVGWLNADRVRAHYNDWDFSKEGRIRQSLRELFVVHRIKARITQGMQPRSRASRPALSQKPPQDFAAVGFHFCVRQQHRHRRAGFGSYGVVTGPGASITVQEFFGLIHGSSTVLKFTPGVSSPARAKQPVSARIDRCTGIEFTDVLSHLSFGNLPVAVVVKLRKSRCGVGFGGSMSTQPA